VYLFLAAFWLVFAVVAQIFWDTLVEHAYVPVGRTAFSVICFVFFSYNFLRWRMQRALRQSQDDESPPPKPTVVHREYDPNLDFTKDDPKP